MPEGGNEPSSSKDDSTVPEDNPATEAADRLTVVAKGPATAGGRISLTELARIASSFQATLERIALSVMGARPKTGRRPQEIARAVQLDFVGFSDGSAKLQLERPATEALDSIFSESLDTLVDGLRAISMDPTSSPRHFTPLVINGLVTLCGGLNRDNIHTISFTAGDNAELFSVNPELRQRLKAIQRQTLREETTLVGRLHMGDFDPMSLRCRIDTYNGSISCEFDDDLRESVFELMNELVMATGIAELQADRSSIRLLHLSGLQAVATSLTPSLDELAAEHNARPLQSFAELRGEEAAVAGDFEDFLEIVRSARR